MCSWITSLIFHQACLNNLYGKINIYIFYQIILDTFIFTKTITNFPINFLNSFCGISTRLYWNCHKSCIINKFYFVTYSDKTFITIFINICNFFFYWNKKSFALFCIFPKTFKFPFKLICKFFYNNVVIIIWTGMKNWRNFIGDIQF